MLLERKYPDEFTDVEKNLFNTKIENEKVRSSAMSIFAYLRKQLRLIGAGIDVIEMSLRKFLKKYRRCHQNISLDTLSKRMRLLADIGFIEIYKNGQKNVYKIKKLDENIEISNSAANLSDGFSDGFSDGLNKAQSIDMTTTEEDSQKPKYKINKDIYNKYITASEIDAIVSEVIKNLDIRRKIVKNAIRSKIKRVAHKLNPAGAYSYVEKVAIDTYNFFRISSERANKIATILMNKKKAKEKKSLKFQNYPQREYDHAALDEELIGWDIEEIVVADSDVIVNTVLIANKTNCFEDDEDLLGWDD